MTAAVRREGFADLWRSWCRERETRGSLTPEFCTQVAERAIELGEYFCAYDVTKAGLARWPDRVRLSQLQALCLIRTHAVQAANRLLAGLEEAGKRDPETLGLLARTHKDLALAAPGEAERRFHGERAFQLYGTAYRVAVRAHTPSEAFYTGLNAASLSVLLGEHERARQLAREVREICLREHGRLEAAGARDYWVEASLGEVGLLLGELAEAERWYRQAARLAAAERKLGHLGSTRKQASLLVRALGVDVGAVDAWLPIPPIVVFAGHLTDARDRSRPRFPEDRVPAVARAIAARLERLQPALGFASAARGADLLFLEAMRARGAETRIVLPFPAEVFVETSVRCEGGRDWEAAFKDALDHAVETTVASDHRAGAGEAMQFDYVNRVLDGLSLLHARSLGARVARLVVWDGRPGDGGGGTGSLVSLWRSRGEQVDVIDPSPGLGDVLQPTGKACPDDLAPHAAAAGTSGAAFSQAPGNFRFRIMAILFGDAAGYSALSEDQVALFVEHVLGPIGERVARSSNAPLVANTWGDGLYFVFDSALRAGRFALELLEALETRRELWSGAGLPADLHLRIALHAGPVIECVDPVTRGRVYTGCHTSRAARIEPVTPPGQVYVSRAFAALAHSEGARDLEFEYAGNVPLAKSYGSLPLYSMRRAGRGAEGDARSQEGDPRIASHGAQRAEAGRRSAGLAR